MRPHIFKFDCGVFQQNVLERFSWAEKMKSTGAVGTDVKAEVEAGGKMMVIVSNESSDKAAPLVHPKGLANRHRVMLYL